MIIDWTNGAIQQLPTAAGLDVWTWSGLSAAVPAAVPASVLGMEWTFPPNPLHFENPSNPLHFTTPTNRLHFEFSEED